MEADDAIGRAREQLLQAVAEVVSELESPGSLNPGLGLRPLADRMTVMDALFERLAQELEWMKRELGRARSERLEDLTLLVDLITTSWRAVDQRLGRIDRKLERMEGLPEPSSSSISSRRAGAPSTSGSGGLTASSSGWRAYLSRLVPAEPSRWASGGAAQVLRISGM